MRVRFIESVFFSIFFGETKILELMMFFVRGIKGIRGDSGVSIVGRISIFRGGFMCDLILRCFWDG